MALTVGFGFSSTKAAEQSLAPAAVIDAAQAKLAVQGWFRRLAQGLELPPAAQTERFSAVSPGIY